MLAVPLNLDGDGVAGAVGPDAAPELVEAVAIGVPSTEVMTSPALMPAFSAAPPGCDLGDVGAGVAVGACVLDADARRAGPGERLPLVILSATLLAVAIGMAKPMPLFSPLLAVDLGVDPDDLGVAVGQRATRVARVDGRIGLDHVDGDACVVVDGPVDGADDAGGDGLLEPERAADGDGHLTRRPAPSWPAWRR